jgi:hypothetical protein
MTSAKDIFDEINKVRENPKSYVTHLEKFESKFEGVYLKRDGKDTLKTEEGWAAVKEAIDKLKS